MSNEKIILIGEVFQCHTTKVLYSPSFFRRILAAVRKVGSTKVRGGLLMPADKSLESTSKMMAEYISVGGMGSNETHGKCVYSTLARRIEKERKPTSPTHTRHVHPGLFASR